MAERLYRILNLQCVKWSQTKHENLETNFFASITKKYQIFPFHPKFHVFITIYTQVYVHPVIFKTFQNWSFPSNLGKSKEGSDYFAQVQSLKCRNAQATIELS